jgi:large-conductance mechanosensitive channel
MATDSSKTPLTPKQNEEREAKEVATKLRNLSPVAKAEVVNEVVAKQFSKQFTGFTEFLREQSVIGIGIGLVLGTQVKAVVDQIMASFVNPLTKLLPGQQALTAKTFVIHAHGREAKIGWGSILYSIFTFVIVMALIYVIFKILKLDKLTKKK